MIHPERNVSFWRTSQPNVLLAEAPNASLLRTRDHLQRLTRLTAARIAYERSRAGVLALPRDGAVTGKIS